MDNVLTAIFKVESEGFQAFAEIQEELKGELFLNDNISEVISRPGEIAVKSCILPVSADPCQVT